VTTELLKRLKVPSLKKPLKAQLDAAGKRTKPTTNPSLFKMQHMEQGPTPQLSVLQILLLQAKHEKS
jgi:hypothetical protein